LVYYGNGGFTLGDVYDMPVFLRIFYMRQLEEAKKTEADMIAAAQKQRKTLKR
jgi:hypothetical protein